ncbi:MAG: hypothetical protein ACLR5G_07870 [Eubacteriales bacterium]
MKEKSENTAEYRFHMLRDPYRPGYHFAIPSGDGRPGDERRLLRRRKIPSDVSLQESHKVGFLLGTHIIDRPASLAGAS